MVAPNAVAAALAVVVVVEVAAMIMKFSDASSVGSYVLRVVRVMRRSCLPKAIGLSNEI